MFCIFYHNKEKDKKKQHPHTRLPSFLAPSTVSALCFHACFPRSLLLLSTSLNSVLTVGPWCDFGGCRDRLGSPSPLSFRASQGLLCPGPPQKGPMGTSLTTLPGRCLQDSPHPAPRKKVDPVYIVNPNLPIHHYCPPHHLLLKRPVFSTLNDLDTLSKIN